MVISLGHDFYTDETEKPERIADESTEYLSKFKSFLINACMLDERFKKLLHELCHEIRLGKESIELEMLLTDEADSESFKQCLFVFNKGLEKFLLKDRKNVVRLYDLLATTVNMSSYYNSHGIGPEQTYDEVHKHMFCYMEEGGPYKIIIKGAQARAGEQRLNALLGYFSIIEDIASVLKPEMILVQSKVGTGDFYQKKEELNEVKESVEKFKEDRKKPKLSKLKDRLNDIKFPLKYQNRFVTWRIDNPVIYGKLKLYAYGLRDDEVEVLEHYLKDRYEIKIKK